MVVAPGRTASGAALLLGAPQTGLPEADRAQLGIEVDLHGAGFDVSGMAVPGIPAVVIGRNAALAWTMTSGISDNVDVYIETLDPANPEEYRWQGGWRRFEARTEEIAIAGRSRPEPFVVRRSVHGPVFAVDADSGQAFSKRRATWAVEMQFLSCLLAMDRAASLEDFDAVLPAFPLSFNILAATASGHLGYWHAGFFQDRADGVDPRLPHDGSGGEEWHGILPFHALPQERDPASGYFANWNNKPVSWWSNGDNMPWVGGQHVRAIVRFLTAPPPLTFERLLSLPEVLGSQGTYEQAIQWSAPIRAANVVPPGESGFVARDGRPDAHFADQWSLYQSYGYKSWRFDSEDGLAAPAPKTDADSASADGGAAGSQGTGQVTILVTPRPASRGLEIRLAATREMQVEVAIYDASGKRVRRLFMGTLAAGDRSFLWDARDEAGHASSPGMYFARINWPRGTETAKIVLGR